MKQVLQTRHATISTSVCTPVGASIFVSWYLSPVVKFIHFVEDLWTWDETTICGSPAMTELNVIGKGEQKPMHACYEFLTHPSQEAYMQAAVSLTVFTRNDIWKGCMTQYVCNSSVINVRVPDTFKEFSADGLTFLRHWGQWYAAFQNRKRHPPCGSASIPYYQVHGVFAADSVGAPFFYYCLHLLLGLKRPEYHTWIKEVCTRQMRDKHSLKDRFSRWSISKRVLSDTETRDSLWVIVSPNLSYRGFLCNLVFTTSSTAKYSTFFAITHLSIHLDCTISGTSVPSFQQKHHTWIRQA